jgi:hypothetical protein
MNHLAQFLLRQDLRIFCPDWPQTVAGGLRQRQEKAPKLSGSKFIKQASSDSVDSSSKAEPREQRGPFLYTI